MVIKNYMRLLVTVSVSIFISINQCYCMENEIKQYTNWPSITNDNISNYTLPEHMQENNNNFLKENNNKNLPTALDSNSSSSSDSFEETKKQPDSKFTETNEGAPKPVLNKNIIKINKSEKVIDNNKSKNTIIDNNTNNINLQNAALVKQLEQLNYEMAKLKFNSGFLTLLNNGKLSMPAVSKNIKSPSSVYQILLNKSNTSYHPRIDQLLPFINYIRKTTQDALKEANKYDKQVHNEIRKIGELQKYYEQISNNLSDNNELKQYVTLVINNLKELNSTLWDYASWHYSVSLTPNLQDLINALDQLKSCVESIEGCKKSQYLPERIKSKNKTKTIPSKITTESSNRIKLITEQEALVTQYIQFVEPMLKEYLENQQLK